MQDFKFIKNAEGVEEYVETTLSGKSLLTSPQLNKGTAFSMEEREEFSLLGKLPIRVENLEEQVQRAYKQFSAYETNLQRNIYLNNLHDKNQVLFYSLVGGHLSEMIPMIYTPIVGTAVKQFSHEFRQPRGLYISYPDIDKIDEILSNRTNPDIEVIVVTDGEGVLGIGDQGIGGMDIPVAKLMVYTLCGGINPCNTLPILLDVGTNNEELLNDPLYLGWRQKRISGEKYDEFIAKFVEAIFRHFPNTYLHWEDFGRSNARRILDQYQEEVCTFNDDIQGTGAVTLSGLLSAVKVTGTELKDQRIIVFGAGTAGTGITDQICDALVKQGLSREEAVKHFWLMDRQGLLINDLEDLTKAQQPYLRDRSEVSDWDVEDTSNIKLAEVVKYIKPTVLIGCSAMPHAFTESIIRDMAANTPRPIIFPLSNPTEKCEAQPQDIMNWTEGKALIATGTGFDPVSYDGHTIPIGQCNNALVFPGIGLGVIVVDSKRLTDHMIWQACQALVEFSPITKDPYAPLLPSLDQAQEVAKGIAKVVAQQAIDDDLARNLPANGDLTKAIEDMFWQPAYLPFKRV